MFLFLFRVRYHASAEKFVTTVTLMSDSVSDLCPNEFPFRAFSRGGFPALQLDWALKWLLV